MKLAELARTVSREIELHVRLRSATHLHFAFADRIDLLNASLWDQLTTPSGLMLSREYLRAMERAETPAMEHRYALVFREEQPIAAVSMQILDVSLDRMHAKPAKKGKRTPVTELEEDMRQRALVCGNLLSYGLDGIAFAPGIDRETRWRAVAEVLYRVRRSEKLQGETNFVLIKDLNESQADDSALLHKLSYRVLETEPNMVLTLEPEWKKYDDYLGAMTSKFRSGVKKAIFEGVTEAGLTVKRMSASEVAARADRLQALYLAVQDNASVRPVTVTRDYWPAMASLEKNAVFTGVYQGDEVVGFLHSQVDGATVVAAQVGFDRAAAKDAPIYLRLLHSAVELAFEAKASRVVFGRTALEPKARMGCKPVTTSMWIRHRVPVVNALVRGVFGMIEHADAPEIDPFKKAKP